MLGPWPDRFQARLSLGVDGGLVAEALPNRLASGQRPDQPRLDRQMWFAALTEPRQVYLFPRFLERLLQNEPAITALLETNPFAKMPPLYVRALFYDYKYANSEERLAGLWWQRQLVATYFTAAHLKSNDPVP